MITFNSQEEFENAVNGCFSKRLSVRLNTFKFGEPSWNIYTDKV